MKIRPFENEDYGLMQHWLELRKRPSPEKSYLSDLGFVVEFDGEPLACGFLYVMSSGQAHLGNFASVLKHSKRSEAVEALIEYLCQLAKNKGAEMVSMSTNLDKLGERLQSLGFEKVEEDIVIYGKDFRCQ